jgi:hypothetical protein
MVTLHLNPNKTLAATNNAKIYFGEHRIGLIRIIAPEMIGNLELENCELTLFDMFGGNYIAFPLQFENNSCDIPITNDITENIGNHKLFIEITSDGNVLGRTNTVNLKVYPFSSGGTEIIKREVYIAEIEELSARVSADESALVSVKNAIAVKNVDIDDETPISEYGNIILKIPSFSGELFKLYLSNTLEGDIEIPYGTTNIKHSAFRDCRITNFTIPNTVTVIEGYAFAYSERIRSMYIPDGVRELHDNIFFRCTNMQTVRLPSTITRILDNAFGSCYNLKTINIPALINAQISYSAFWGCQELEYVTIENGFSSNNLTLSASTLYSRDTIVSWLNALADRTSETTYTFTIGSTNIAKLSADDIAIATNKNWNLA